MYNKIANSLAHKKEETGLPTKEVGLASEVR